MGSHKEGQQNVPYVSEEGHTHMQNIEGQCCAHLRSDSDHPSLITIMLIMLYHDVHCLHNEDLQGLARGCIQKTSTTTESYSVTGRIWPL